MEKIIAIEAEMSSHGFDILNLFDEIVKYDKRRAISMLGRITDLLNEKAVVEVKKIELQRDYDMGLISKEELKQRISWL